MEEFVAYRKFSLLPAAEDMIELLKKNNIPYEFEDNSPSADLSATYGSVPQSEFIVKIMKEDFSKTDTLLEKEALEIIPTLDKEYYLFSFTNDELYDVIENYDKWNTVDFILAQQILRERGEVLTDEVTIEKKERRIRDLAEPESAMQGWIFIGYISAVLGGVLGMFIGYHHWKFKKRLPNGERVFTYDEISREKGRILFYTGAFFFIIWSAVYIFLLK